MGIHFYHKVVENILRYVNIEKYFIIRYKI